MALAVVTKTESIVLQVLLKSEVGGGGGGGGMSFFVVEGFELQEHRQLCLPTRPFSKHHNCKTPIAIVFLSGSHFITDGF